jgi:hypothetical protein
MESKLQLLKPRTLGDVINDMFVFVRQNLGSLWRTILILVMPFALLSGLFFTSYMSSISSFSRNSISGSEFQLSGMTSLFANVFLVFVGSMLAYIFMHLLVIQLFLQYEQPGDNLPGVKDLLNGVKNSLLRFIGFNLLAFCILIGAYLLIILFFVLIAKAAGIAVSIFLGLALLVGFMYAAVAFSMVPFIYMRERNGFFNAISRSFYLIKGFWWQTFGIIFLTAIIIYFGFIICAIPFYTMFAVSLLHSVKNGMPLVYETSVWSALAGALMMCGGTLLNTLLFAAVIVQYYSLTERKDGESTMRQIESIGEEVNPAI